MYCKYCGKKLDDGVSFCTGCGKPVQKQIIKSELGSRNKKPKKTVTLSGSEKMMWIFMESLIAETGQLLI